MKGFSYKIATIFDVQCKSVSLINKSFFPSPLLLYLFSWFVITKFSKNFAHAQFYKKVYGILVNPTSAVPNLGWIISITLIVTFHLFSPNGESLRLANKGLHFRTFGIPAWKFNFNIQQEGNKNKSIDETLPRAKISALAKLLYLLCKISLGR